MRPVVTRGIHATVSVLCAAALVTGCSASSKNSKDPFELPSLGPVQLDVDTPQLRQAKAEAGIEACRPGTATPVTDGPPEVSLACLGGGPEVNLATLRGPLIINVWATWCEPCRHEMPILADFYQRHGDDVDVLGVTLNLTFPDTALTLARRAGVTYPLVSDANGDVLGTSVFRRALVPTTAFVDANGKVTAVIPIEIKSEQQLVGLVNEHLGLDL